MEDNGGFFGGLLGSIGNMFGGGQPQPGMPMDIRPQGLQNTMQQQAQPDGFGGYNAMGDIGMRLLAAGQPMTAAQRGQIVGSIPGAVTNGMEQDNRHQALMAYMHQRGQGQQPAGLLGTANQAAANNQIWNNLGRGMNADGSANVNSGFAGMSNTVPMAGNNGYGLY